MFNSPLLCPPFKSERCCVAKQLLAQPRFLKDALQELFSLSSDLCVQEQADMNQNDGERRRGESEDLLEREFEGGRT